MLTRDEAQKLAKKVIGMATFPECQVAINSSEQAYTRFANNGMTQNQSPESIGFRCG